MSRIEDFLIGKVLCRMVGIRIEMTDQEIIVRTKNAKLANAIIARLRERAERENDQQILSLLREART